MVERGGDESRIEVCHTNVDTHVFRPMPEARAEVRGRLRLPADEPIVLFLGRISADKQPRVLSAALTLLFTRGLRFTAVIVGDGPDRGWLEAALRDAGVGDRVRMLGSVENDEIPPLMAGADIFFIPSRSEGISVALYEAMASGTAVVGARVGGQAELVTEDCGVLIERSTLGEEAEKYADAIELLLRDPERCAAMGRAARARAEVNFPLERLGTRVNELLETAIEHHATNPQPVPTETMARRSATEAIELMRLAVLMDAMWGSYGVGTGLRGIGVTFYVFLRRVGRPMYLWGLRRGWRWLPRLRDRLARVLTGYSA
jgi:glycosyltransferase involved in cell wall biosynthesis